MGGVPTGFQGDRRIGRPRKDRHHIILRSEELDAFFVNKRDFVDGCQPERSMSNHDRDSAAAAHVADRIA